jgi:hypothetical protein
MRGALHTSVYPRCRLSVAGRSPSHNAVSAIQMGVSMPRLSLNSCSKHSSRRDQRLAVGSGESIPVLWSGNRVAHCYMQKRKCIFAMPAGQRTE